MPSRGSDTKTSQKASKNPHSSLAQPARPTPQKPNNNLNPTSSKPTNPASSQPKDLKPQNVDQPTKIPFFKKFIKKRISKKTIIKFTIFGLVIAALLVYLAWDIITKGPLMQLLSNRDELVKAMNDFGPWAPFFYITLQILQVVVAPIPGQIVGGVGGFLFGHWGILWTTIGSFIGFWLVFSIARKFGRPLVERIFKKSAVDKFDFIINAKGAALIIFAIFLLPGFPDDLVCYIAGLTKLSMKKLMLISILGRFPTIVITNYIGMGLSDNIELVIILSLAVAIFVGLIVWQRDRIMAFLKREGKPQD